MNPAKEFVRRLLPRSIRNHRVLRGPLRGDRIVTSWHDYPGAILGRTERPLLEWFRHNVRAGETWLDVGAHYGYTAIALARLTGGEGRVFAFEPVAATAGCISRTRQLNDLHQLTVVPLALDDRADLRVSDLPVIRGMADSTIQSLPSERILTASLDAIWPSLSDGDETVHGIKVDVQGMELAVLRGMQGILRRAQPKLVIEFHRGVDRHPILRLLESCGYSTNAEPIEPDAPPLADDHSYSFQPLATVCESLSTPSSIVRS